MIIIRIIVLFLFLIFVEKYPKLKNFSDETKFNVYRSLICLFFTLYAFDNVINNVINGYNDPFNFKVPGFQDVSEWFMAYIMLDMGKMIWMKNKRWDLYVHHIWCLLSTMTGFYYNKIGLFEKRLRSIV